MKCERLIFLIKNWYVKVQEEAMAPARMVAFMENHISQCEICLADLDVKQETNKIREIVLPPSKAPKPKVARAAKEDVEDDEIEGEAVEDEEEVEDEVENEDEDEDEDDFGSDIMDEDDEI